MYLEDVRIEGFKSFSEKTDMSFQPGISVIIGNNGVGKSNVLDAIVWALGESNLEQLRCYADKEIFFAGSPQHPPARSATVELTFRQGKEDAAPPINVRRQVEINGSDKRYIADQPYTPADFRDNLAALNLKHALKTIIRQEQINDILLQEPGKRLETICSLLGLPSVETFSGPLLDGIGERLRRYMSYLIPEAETRIELLNQNGKAGLDVVVTLPGNRMRRAHQLSGGEKAVTSLALKLAVFHHLQNSFILMDEVEPSLDYTHHKSMQAFLKDLSADTQLIMITHLRSTIELADTLHGIRTRPDGSSFMKFYFDMDERLLRLYKCC